jgi:hypothetical protein
MALLSVRTFSHRQPERTMPSTKHLDTAISILKGSPAAKRAPRKAQVELEVWVTKGTYLIVSNGKTIEEGQGDDALAKERAEARATAIRALGKTVVVYTY